MSQRPGTKSLAEQQEAFKKGLLNQSKVLASIDETRKAQIKSHAYDHLTPVAFDGKTHINTEIYKIIQFLKERDRPVCFDEIKQYLNLDISNRPELFRQVSNNDRISCNIPFLEYKPLYNIRGKEELLAHLKKSATIYGFDIKDIRDIFPKVNQAVHDLMASKSILGLGPKEDNIQILFYNDLVLPIYPDSDVKKLWHGQIIPDEHDLRVQLRNAGLKGLEIIHEKPKPASSAKRSSSNRYRRIKMTNTHLADFDFSQEYNGQ